MSLSFPFLRFPRVCTLLMLNGKNLFRLSKSRGWSATSRFAHGEIYMFKRRVAWNGRTITRLCLIKRLKHFPCFHIASQMNDLRHLNVVTSWQNLDYGICGPRLSRFASRHCPVLPVHLYFPKYHLDSVDISKKLTRLVLIGERTYESRPGRIL